MGGYDLFCLSGGQMYANYSSLSLSLESVEFLFSLDGEV